MPSTTNYCHYYYYYRVLTTVEKLENSGNFLILGNSENFCVIMGIEFVHNVSNSSIYWLDGTLTGVGGASHHAA